MKKIITTATILLIWLGILFTPNVVDAATVTYYYSENCSVCKTFIPYWDKFKQDSGAEHTITEKRITATLELHKELLDITLEKKGSAQAQIPAIHVSGIEGTADTLLVGLNEINTLPALLTGQTNKTMNIPVEPPQPQTTAPISTSNLIIIVTLAALADAANPCALFVFVLATSYASVYSGKRKALLYGAAFSIAMYSTYFIAGLMGTIVINHIFQNTRIISLILSIGVVILAGLHIQTALRPEKRQYSELTDQAKYKLIRYAEKCISVGGAIIAGIACAMIELPCTGGPYVFALSLVAKLQFWNAALWIAYYNFIFILPLLFILGVILIVPEKLDSIDEWRTQNKRRLHLAMGIALMAAGLWGIGLYL